jgi:hypothetical protein
VTAPNDQYASDPTAQVGGTASDQAYISGLAATGDSPFYMTAASPWFFTVCLRDWGQVRCESDVAHSTSAPTPTTRT